MEESIIKKIFSNPYMNFISILIGIAGIILGVYFYFQSQESRELIYSVNPSRALVVDSKKASNLHVLYDGQIVSSDIVAVQIAIWNHGKQAIKRADILEPIEIQTSDSIKILETSIRKISRKVTKLSLSINKYSKKFISLDWDILEKDDGAVIQVLYSGKLGTQFFINGVIEGQSIIHQVSSPDNEDRQAPYPVITMGIGFLTIGLFGRFQLKKGDILREKYRAELREKFFDKLGKEPDDPKESRTYRNVKIVIKILIIFSIILLLIGTYLWMSLPPSAPFGF